MKSARGEEVAERVRGGGVSRKGDDQWRELRELRKLRGLRELRELRG